MSKKRSTKGLRIVAVGANDTIREVLDLTGLNRYVPLYATQTEAVSDLAN